MKLSPKPKRWTPLLLGAAGVALVAGWGSTSHAQSDEPVPDPNATLPANATGACTASATISNGYTINPYESGGLFIIPLSGSASYAGSVAATERDRPASGEVEIETPPGIPSISNDDRWRWGPRVTGVSKRGDVECELSDWLPRDVELTVSGSHQDGEILCEGSVKIAFDGSPWDSPITPISLGGTAVALGGLAWTARPKGLA
jgi:hypothetical protein